MSSSPRLFSFVPPLVLVVLAGGIAAAVDRFVLPDGLPITRSNRGHGSPAIRTGASTYPREAVDSDGYVVRIARPARRVVSQYWSLDEYVYSVVPPERVVAVSQNAYHEPTSNVYRHAAQFHPAVAADVETVLRLDPDLILVSNSSRADFCALVRSAGVPIYRAFTMFTTLGQVTETIRLTGYLTGEDQAAAKELERFHSEIEKARSMRPANAPRPRILGYSGGHGYGSETLFDDIVRTLGGINVGAEGGLKGYSQVNIEQIVRWNPEWIVTGANKGKTDEALARLLADPGIALTQAARNRRILVFENHIFLPQSPFTTRFVGAIAKAIYGSEGAGL